MDSKVIQLSELLPPKVWADLLNKMDNGNARNKIMLACPPLKGLFGSDFVSKYLFGAVLPFLADHLNVMDILNCRQVCSLWHKDIHNLILDQPCRIPYNEDPENGFRGNTAKINRTCPLFLLATSKPVLRFQNYNEIDEFVKNNTRFDGRKIYGGTILLDPSADAANSMELYEQSSYELLRSFSTGIKKIMFSSDDWNESTVKFYHRLRQSLELIPNLQLFCATWKSKKVTLTLNF